MSDNIEIAKLKARIQYLDQTLVQQQVAMQQLSRTIEALELELDYED